VDALALGEFEKVFDALGYALAYQEAIPGPEVIRRRIEGYRSSDYYPGETTFKVTDWRVASGGNPNPKKEVTRFEPSTLGLLVAISFDLPLNGKWSDLTAEFVVFASTKQDRDCSFSLEEISSWAQTQREIAKSEVDSDEEP